MTKSLDNFRIPPFDLDAEKTILGSIVADNQKLHTVMEKIETDDFYDRSNQIIFQAMIELMNSNVPVDLVTLKDLLNKSGKLEDIGGIQYLVKITDDIISTANVEYHTGIIREKSNFRKLISIGNKLISKGYDGNESVNNIIEDAENAIFSVLGKNIGMGIGQVRDYLKSAIGLIEKRCRDQGNLTGIPTSFIELDRITDGLQKSDLIILACRPSVGKTSLSLNIMQNASIRHNLPTLFFSLEMSK
ncbi:replicative DNA helicase, partial [bacterium]|nr:replicative DNA helicase [bacterium]